MYDGSNPHRKNRAHSVTGRALHHGHRRLSLAIPPLGWYAQRRRTLRLERNPNFSRCAMLLNANFGNSCCNIETNLQLCCAYHPLWLPRIPQCTLNWVQLDCRLRVSTESFPSTISLFTTLSMVWLSPD